MATFVWLSNISCANCGSSAWNVRSHWGNTSDPDVKNCAQDPLLTWLTQQDTESMLFSNSLGTCRSILSFTWLTTAEDVILPKCCWNDSALDKESSSNSKLTERLTREGSVTFRYSTETCRLRNTSSSSILARPNPKNSEQAAPSSVPAFQEQIGLKSKVIRQPRAYEVLSTPLRSLVVIPAMLVVDPFVSESEIIICICLIIIPHSHQKHNDHDAGQGKEKDQKSNGTSKPPRSTCANWLFRSSLFPLWGWCLKSWLGTLRVGKFNDNISLTTGT